MFYFLSAFWCLLELIFFYFFWTAFLPSKQAHRKTAVAAVCYWTACVLVVSIVENDIPKVALTWSLSFLLATYLLRGPWYQRILFVFLGYTIGGSIDAILVYGVSTLLGISSAEFMWMKLFYTATVTTSKLLSILFAWAINKLRKRVRDHAIQRRWLLLSLLFPGVSTVMLTVIYATFQNAQDLSIGAVIFNIFLVIANVAILYLISSMEKATKQVQEHALLRQQMEIQTDSIVALERSYRNQRQATHEFQNQLQTIYELLLNEQTSQAQEYIRQLRGQQTARILVVNSHHPIIDAILNHKYQTAKSHGIDFQIQVNDLSRLSIGADELVVLLSNLLDNAIEACCRVQHHRAIQCSILADETLFLSVRNTSVPVTILDDTIPTSKTPKEEHGFGLSRIRLILKQLHAEYTFTYENGWFEFVAEIPYSDVS